MIYIAGMDDQLDNVRKPRADAVRNRARAVVIYAVVLVFAAALVHRFIILGEPYFRFPKTVQDHVAPAPYPSRDVILLGLGIVLISRAQIRPGG